MDRRVVVVVVVVVVVMLWWLTVVEPNGGRAMWIVWHTMPHVCVLMRLFAGLPREPTAAMMVDVATAQTVVCPCQLPAPCMYRGACSALVGGACSTGTTECTTTPNGDASDTTPPTFTASYPAAVSTTGTSISINVAMSEPGWFFYVIMDASLNPATPSPLEVTQGSGASGATAVASGSIPIGDANLVAAASVQSGLAQEKTCVTSFPNMLHARVHDGAADGRPLRYMYVLPVCCFGLLLCGQVQGVWCCTGRSSCREPPSIRGANDCHHQGPGPRCVLVRPSDVLLHVCWVVLYGCEWPLNKRGFTYHVPLCAVPVLGVLCAARTHCDSVHWRLPAHLCHHRHIRVRGGAAVVHRQLLLRRAARV